MNTIGDYTIVRDEHGYALLERPDGKRTVVRISWDRGQVYDAMPGDAPTDGGSWCARISQSGVNYVASWYSRSWANRVYREAVRALRDLDDLQLDTEPLYSLTDRWSHDGQPVTLDEAQAIVDHLHDLDSEARRELYERADGSLMFEDERGDADAEIVGYAVEEG